MARFVDMMFFFFLSFLSLLAFIKVVYRFVPVEFIVVRCLAEQVLIDENHFLFYYYFC